MAIFEMALRDLFAFSLFIDSRSELRQRRPSRRRYNAQRLARKDQI